MWRIGGAVLALLIAIADVPEGIEPWQPWTALSAVVAVAALVSREHTRPLGAVTALGALAAVAFGAEVVDSPGQVPFGQFVVVALVLADVAYAGDRRTVAGVGVLGSATAVAVEGLADDRTVGDVVFLLSVWALAMATALAIRWRRQAEAAKAEQVRTAERERIARELHDVVAHHVSAIAMSAEGARAALDDDHADVDRSLAGIHDAASSALDEMRQIVRILRDDEPLAVGTDLSDLVEFLGPDGTPPVLVSVDDDLGRPGQAVTGAVFRIAREAVTNCRRHAVGATRIQVDVRCEGDELTMTITDDGSRSRPASGTTGFGLRGMGERAELIGGSCTSGPTPTGGWRVEARLPTGRSDT